MKFAGNQINNDDVKKKKLLRPNSDNDVPIPIII